MFFGSEFQAWGTFSGGANGMNSNGLFYNRWDCSKGECGGQNEVYISLILLSHPQCSCWAVVWLGWRELSGAGFGHKDCRVVPKGRSSGGFLYCLMGFAAE
jgi:hypothetical protein